jgi:hypothetical protein
MAQVPVMHPTIFQLRKPATAPATAPMPYSLFINIQFFIIYPLGLLDVRLLISHPFIPQQPMLASVIPSNITPNTTVIVSFAIMPCIMIATPKHNLRNRIRFHPCNIAFITIEFVFLSLSMLHRRMLQWRLQLILTLP